MPQAPYIVIEREYDASPQRVFDAWTDANHLLEWFHGSAEIKVQSAVADVREGGHFRVELVGPNDHYVIGGQYTEVRPPDILEFTWKWDESTIEPTETLVRLEFQPVGTRTLMRLTHSKFSSERASQAHDAGWAGVLSSLATFLSKDK